MRRFWNIILTIFLIAALCLPAGALTFTDTNEIQNLDAVTIMANLALVNGYEDNTFRPRNNIRRSEAAKLAALICDKAPKAAGTVSFSDVNRDFWAAEYVAFCSEKGFIAGANGKFRPNDYVTGREFAKMMLGCLGYDGSRYVGARWAENVDSDAERLGIYTGFTADPAAIVSRDNACLLMYNAMQCYAVTGKDAAGKDVYALDQLMNPMTYMEYRFGVVKFSGVLEANEFADLTAAGGRLEAGYSRLQGHAAFQVSTPYEFLGRTVEMYTIHDSVGATNYYSVIGIPHLADVDQAFTTQDEQGYLLALRYAGVYANEATEYYLNGDRTGSDLVAKLGADCAITAVDRNGDKLLDAVLASDYEAGTVISAEPLTIACGDRTLPGGFLGEERALQPGESIRCIIAGGVCWID